MYRKCITAIEVQTGYLQKLRISHEMHHACISIYADLLCLLCSFPKHFFWSAGSWSFVSAERQICSVKTMKTFKQRRKIRFIDRLFGQEFFVSNSGVLATQVTRWNLCDLNVSMCIIKILKSLSKPNVINHVAYQDKAKQPEVSDLMITKCHLPQEMCKGFIRHFEALHKRGGRKVQKKCCRNSTNSRIAACLHNNLQGDQALKKSHNSQRVGNRIEPNQWQTPLLSQWVDSQRPVAQKQCCRQTTKTCQQTICFPLWLWSGKQKNQCNTDAQKRCAHSANGEMIFYKFVIDAAFQCPFHHSDDYPKAPVVYASQPATTHSRPSSQGFQAFSRRSRSRIKHCINSLDPICKIHRVTCKWEAKWTNWIKPLYGSKWIHRPFHQHTLVAKAGKADGQQQTNGMHTAASEEYKD